MAHIEGVDRSQTLLLPEAVDDHFGTANTVRSIDAFVDEHDLEWTDFIRAKPKARGRPGYHAEELQSKTANIQERPDQLHCCLT